MTTAKCAAAKSDGSTVAGAICSCGTNDVQVAADAFCFLKADKTGVSSATATIACAGGKTDGSTAAGGDGCYCGTSGTLAAAAKFCDTGLAATGTLMTTAKCAAAKSDGSTVAGAICSCGTNDVQVAADAFCFVKNNKTAAKTVAAASTDGVNAGVAFTALCLAITAPR